MTTYSAVGKWVLKSIGHWVFIGHDKAGNVLTFGEIVLRPWGDIDVWVDGTHTGYHRDMMVARISVENLSKQYQKFLANHRVEKSTF